MSDFLAGSLDQARAKLALKRSAGALYGKAETAKEIADKKPKWLADKPSTLKKTKQPRGKTNAFELSDYDLERSRKALERKEKQYKKMFNRGTDMHLQGEAADNLLIDFDRKWAEGHRQEPSDDSEGEGEGIDARLPSDDEFDPMIEIEDEFGRARKIRKSEALRHEKPPVVNARPANLIYGRHLQTFNPDAQKKDEIWAEEEASKEVHYDPNFEVRERGAGYINLGRGKDRTGRMNDLSHARQETVNVRSGHGLVEPEAPPLVTMPINAQEIDHQAYIHPSRRQNYTNQPKADSTRDAARVRAGEAFLNSIL